MDAGVRMTMMTLALSILAPRAGAEEPGERVLRLLDQAMTQAQDQYFVHQVTTREPGKEPRRMKMQVRIKGSEWRRIEFLEPGDVKGMRVLVRSLNQMYVYLPAYRKVRRVASHVRSQGFMGTTFCDDDIGTVTYGPLFTAKLLAESDTHWTLEARLRPGQEYPYPRLEFDILKNNHQPSQIRYFNGPGQNIKTEHRSNYECRGTICNPKLLKMVDHTRNDTWTEIACLQWEVNTGVEDSYFTVRALQSRN